MENDFFFCFKQKLTVVGSALYPDFAGALCPVGQLLSGILGIYYISFLWVLLAKHPFYCLGKRDEQNILWFSRGEMPFEDNQRAAWRYGEGIRSVGLAKVNCHDAGLSVLDTVRFLPGVVPPLPDFYQGQRLIFNLPVWQRQSWDGDFPPPSPKAGSDEVQRPFDDLTNRFQRHPSAFLH